MCQHALKYVLLFALFLIEPKNAEVINFHAKNIESNSMFFEETKSDAMRFQMNRNCKETPIDLHTEIK